MKGLAEVTSDIKIVDGRPRVQNTLGVSSVSYDSRSGEDVQTDRLRREGIRPGGFTGQSSVLQVWVESREPAECSTLFYDTKALEQNASFEGITCVSLFLYGMIELMSAAPWS